MIKVNTPLTSDVISKLKAGDEVLLTGIIYTARDQAHKKLVSMIESNKNIPFKLKESIIYYTGSSSASPDKIIGSCGPTTSSRMDKYTPLMLEAGIVAMIGKGRRDSQIKEAISKYKAVYFLAPAGCGALISDKVKSSSLIAFEELGPEAIYRLEVEELPLIVGIDSLGNDIYN